MVEALLTKEMIDAGSRLVSHLDEQGSSPDAAFWLYSPEDQDWKMVLVEAKLLRDGPKAGYSRLQRLLAKYSKDVAGLELDDLVLEKPDAKIVRLIRSAVRTGPGIRGIRFRNNVIDGTLIDDAYIYRVA